MDTNRQETAATDSLALVTGRELIDILFPNGPKPCLRTLDRHVKRRHIPSVRIGRVRWYSLKEARAALLNQQPITRRGAR